MDSSEIYEQVRKHYTAASQSTNASYSKTVAKSFGYSDEELASISEDANLGLSCGNPLAIASVKEGETIIDLGCGAGFDVFLAAPRVGDGGAVIGVDMSEDMLARANKIKAAKNAINVSFVKWPITSIDIQSRTADCIISNCVINLVPEPEKGLVFKEMFRLLKPGGRVAVSDILAKKPLPEDLRSDVSMYVGCIAGASLVASYEAWLKQAGFCEILIVDSQANLNVYADTKEDGTKQSKCCAPKDSHEADKTEVRYSSARFSDVDLNDWVGSYKIYAVKGWHLT